MSIEGCSTRRGTVATDVVWLVSCLVPARSGASVPA